MGGAAWVGKGVMELWSVGVLMRAWWHRERTGDRSRRLSDRSQAIYCLEQVQSRIRPVGHGLILTPGCLIVLIVARLSDPIIPCPTGRFAFFARIPGNKLPGYYHPVPTGRPGRAGACPYRFRLRALGRSRSSRASTPAPGLPAVYEQAPKRFLSGREQYRARSRR